MSNKTWFFDTIQTVSILSFDSLLEEFGKKGVKALVRENIQNSLDAKISKDNPVIVKIKIGEIENNLIPGIEELLARVEELKGGAEGSRNTINEMKKIKLSGKSKYLLFEDENTKGLTEKTWNSYAYETGKHLEDEDEKFEKIRGGSFGVGKIASNAASLLHTVIFSNCDENNKKNIGGTVKFIDHKLGEICYRGNGYFSQFENTGYIPYVNDYEGVFRKDTRGLKLIIPFLRESFDDEVEIVRGICDNFFIAILKEELIIEFNELKINKSTLENIIKDEKYYPNEMKTTNESYFTQKYFNSYVRAIPEIISINIDKREYAFKMYLTKDESIKKLNIGIFRNIGMKIQNRKISNYIIKPYNILIIPNSEVEDAFLKTLENESHTELQYSHIRNEEIKKHAKKFLIDFDNKIKEIIDEREKNSENEQEMVNVEEVLYSNFYNLKKIKEKENNESLKTNTSSNMNKKEVVKLNTPKLREKVTSKKTKNPNIFDALKKIKKILNKKEKDKEGRKRVRYIMNSNNVDRVILGNKEILNFSLEHIDLKNIKKCDIYMVIISGEEKIIENEFNLNDNYESIKNAITNEKYKIIDNIIKDVSIENNKIKLENILKPVYNKNFKFEYYVEV